MIKNSHHFLLILGPKHDISKRRLKRRILSLFKKFFWPEITSKKFESNIFRLNSKRAIDWCIDCPFPPNTDILTYAHDINFKK
jgi:hypothetical protein